MKSKFVSILSLALIFCLLCGVSAYAADETELQTVITYTKTADTEETEDSGGPSLPIYEIAIPSELSLNSGDTIPIYLTENNLPDGELLRVNIDADRTIAEDGYMHLQGTHSETPAKVLIGYYLSDGNRMYIDKTGIYEVAIFESGNVHPISSGTLFFSVKNDSELIADTYTGTVYFTLFTTSE